MSQQKFDLETFQFILSQFSEDVVNDCSRIIIKLLKSLPTSVHHESEVCNEKVFASVKILLNLYEFLNLNNSNIKLELPINIISEKVKLIFQCNYESCNLPENYVQVHILSIISSVLKCGLLQNSGRSLEELNEFHDCNINSIQTAISRKECKPDCLIFKVKVMTAMYQALGNVKFESYVDFCEKIKLVNDSVESELLIDLALHEDDGVAFQTLFHLIPAKINFYKSNRVMEIIWKQISASMICDIKQSRVLIVLCQIFDLCWDKSMELTDQIDLTTFLFNDANYWKLVQLALKDRDPVKKKQGIYLFKKTLDILKIENKNIFCGNNEEYTFYWHLDYKDELLKVYSEIIIILEFLEEQQFHIIEPIFKLIKTVTENILNSDKVNYSWILVVYEKALLHESLQVVKWGLKNLLELQEKFFSNEDIARESAELLAVTLNNMSLYFNNGLAISRDLETFFRTASRIFYKAFIKKVCSQVWSAEALFFVTLALLSDFPYHRQFTPLGNEEISEVTNFVLKVFRTHNKIIRTGVQIKLLEACLSLTDKNVSLENFIYLISIFFEREILKVKSENWQNVICWIKDSYSEEDAKAILEKHLMEKSRNKPKVLSLMFILFYDAYNMFSLNNYEFDFSAENDRILFPLECFQEILLSYKEIHKRPYCNKLIHDQNLSLICDIYEVNSKNLMPAFIEPTLPFLKDVILYIQSQLSLLSGLQDFSDMELYLKAFEHIVKTFAFSEFNFDHANNIYIEILNELESHSRLDSRICSIGMFWRIKVLNIMLKLNFIKPKPSYLDSYLLKAVNEPLEKDDGYSEKTRHLTLWGTLNSKFLEHKWECLEYLINKKLVMYECVKKENRCWISNDDLIRLCVEAVNIGGYGVLSPVLSILKNLLPAMEINLEMKIIIDSIWKVILERKKTEEYKIFIRKFVEMVFQEALIDKGGSTVDILLEYTDLIFADSSLAVVNILMKHVQGIEITKSAPLFCRIIGKGLIFGAVDKKDEKLTKTVCFHIEYLKICNVKEISDYNTSNEIRARAVQRILKLNKKSPEHQTIARLLIDTLLNYEKELNKNRTRYYGNSHVHRVKHRLMQALLLLEPMLNSNEEQAVKLSKWVINSLMSENSQPSVRYMQEWLLIRILYRHSEVCARFHYLNFYDSQVTKKAFTCSWIGVVYHLYELISIDLMRTRVTSDLENILSHCFHRNFEIRVYAQVVFLMFYNKVSKFEGIKNIIQSYKTVYEVLEACVSEESSRNKALEKLIIHFYFKDFHPLESYSLETIYKNLPKLTDVSSDEWISAKMFEHCGVKSSETDVPLKNFCHSLNYSDLEVPMFKTFKHYVPSEFDDPKLDNFSDNYQKKIIPIKPLITDWNKENCCRSTVKKDGLIVVASLIDRVPNLGGLARTCEVFGASEYIINSLKYTEDKQFTSLSVTAEKWVTVKEVKVQHLLDYISEMKQDGYTIIGAEQALVSQPLHAVKFPKKSLLVLGNEREGIPPNLLPFLDVCIEVPQLGLIRSLNVHVTGALFIWEYAKQHHFS